METQVESSDFTEETETEDSNNPVPNTPDHSKESTSKQISRGISPIPNSFLDNTSNSKSEEKDVTINTLSKSSELAVDKIVEDQRKTENNISEKKSAIKEELKPKKEDFTNSMNECKTVSTGTSPPPQNMSTQVYFEFIYLKNYFLRTLFFKLLTSLQTYEETIFKENGRLRRSASLAPSKGSMRYDDSDSEVC